MKGRFSNRPVSSSVFRIASLLRTSTHSPAFKFSTVGWLPLSRCITYSLFIQDICGLKVAFLDFSESPPDFCFTVESMAWITCQEPTEGPNSEPAKHVDGNSYYKPLSIFRNSKGSNISACFIKP